MAPFAPAAGVSPARVRLAEPDRSARSERRLDIAAAARGRVPGWSTLTICVLTALAFALRARGMDEGLYGDEFFTLSAIRGHDFAGMLDTLINGAGGGAPLENTPPLHFVLAWLAARLGDPTEWIRLPSIVLGTAIVPLVYLLGLRTVGRTAAIVAAGFMAISPFAIWYGIDARAYGTLMFFSALSAYTLLRGVETSQARWWVAYGASVAAVLYTHYTGGCVLAAQAAWALWCHREQWRSLVLAYAGAGAAFAVWLPFVRSDPADFGALAALRGINYLDSLLIWLAGSPELPPEELPGLRPLALIGLGLLLVLLAGALAFIRRRGRRQAGEILSLSPAPALVLVLALATPVCALLYGVVSTDLFLLARNLSASLPFVALAAGWALTRPNRAAAAVAVGLAAVGLGAGTADTLDERFQRPNFPAVAQLLDERARPGEPVVYYGPGFEPFVLAANMPSYYGRAHTARNIGLNLTPAFGRRGDAPERVFLVELQGASEVPPEIPGWEKVEQRTYPGIFTLFVAVYEPLRGKS